MTQTTQPAETLPSQEQVFVTGLDDAISFDAGVDCMFYSKMVSTATKYWNAQKKTADVPTSEVLRRAIALIEAVLTDQLIIQEQPANRCDHA